MSNARIGFSTTDHLLSRVIRFVTNSEVSHVWFVYWDEDWKCDMVMEAHYTWQLIPLDIFKKSNLVVEIIEPVYPVDDAVRFAVQWLGSGYDVKGLIGGAIVKVGKWLHHCWKNPFRSTRNVYCSEGVSRGLLGGKSPLGFECGRYAGFKFEDPETIEPEEMRKWLHEQRRDLLSLGTK